MTADLSDDQDAIRRALLAKPGSTLAEIRAVTGLERLDGRLGAMVLSGQVVIDPSRGVRKYRLTPSNVGGVP